MYSNTELMYQLQKFEDKLNQHPRTIQNGHLHYEAGYLNASADGPYYYVNEIIDGDDGRTSERFLTTIEQVSGNVSLNIYVSSIQLDIINHFVSKLARHGLIDTDTDFNRPTIQLHPIFDEYDKDVLHP